MEDTKDKQQLEGLAKMREPFLPNQISKMCRSTKRDNPKGKCSKCGGMHGFPSIQLDYVGHAALTDRLLSVDPFWTWEIVSKDAIGYPALDKDGGLWITLTVCGVTRYGYGDAQGKSGGDAMKERIGDALRNAAMRFGAALDLWHKGDLHIEEDNNEEGKNKPPLKEPQSKTETQELWEGKADDKTTATLITKVIKKEDIGKDGKPYKKYTIIDSHGKKYSTFSDTFANIAIEARDKGLPVNIISDPPKNPAWAHDLVDIKVKTIQQPSQGLLEDELTPEKCHELVAVYKVMIEVIDNMYNLTEWEKVNQDTIKKISDTEPEAYVSLMMAYDSKFTELKEG